MHALSQRRNENIDHDDKRNNREKCKRFDVYCINIFQMNEQKNLVFQFK